MVPSNCTGADVPCLLPMVRKTGCHIDGAGNFGSATGNRQTLCDLALGLGRADPSDRGNIAAHAHVRRWCIDFVTRGRALFRHPRLSAVSRRIWVSVTPPELTNWRVVFTFN